MKNKSFIFLSLSFALLIPFQGRLGYGIVFLAVLNLLSVACCASRLLARLLSLESLKNAVMAMTLVAAAVLLRQVMVLISPVIVLTIGLGFFLPAISSFFVGNIFLKPADSFIFEIKVVLKETLLFSVYALFFYVLSDIIAYGTITLPSSSGLFEIILFDKPGSLLFAGTFFATIPGRIVAVALSFFLYNKILDVMHKIKSEEKRDAQ